jgi:hypothetical protein
MSILKEECSASPILIYREISSKALATARIVPSQLADITDEMWEIAATAALGAVNEQARNRAELIAKADMYTILCTDEGDIATSLAKSLCRDLKSIDHSDV